MRGLPATRLLSAWLALLAMLAVALAPTLVQVLQGPALGPGALAEVCSASGTRRVPLAGDADAGKQQPSKPVAEHFFSHCPCCPGGTHAPVLPSASWAPLPLPALSDAPPLAFLAAPTTLHAWRSSQARAPPHHA